MEWERQREKQHRDQKQTIVRRTSENLVSLEVIAMRLGYIRRTSTNSEVRNLECGAVTSTLSRSFLRLINLTKHICLSANVLLAHAHTSKLGHNQCQDLYNDRSNGETSRL